MVQRVSRLRNGARERVRAELSQDAWRASLRMTRICLCFEAGQKNIKKVQPSCIFGDKRTLETRGPSGIAQLPRFV